MLYVCLSCIGMFLMMIGATIMTYIAVVGILGAILLGIEWLEKTVQKHRIKRGE